MSYSHRSHYSQSPSPPPPYWSRSPSRSPRYRSRSRESSVENPGNNLYVTGLSGRATKRDLEDHFSSEGKVVGVHLVTDPWSKESRGFGFVTMSSLDEAERCIKYLNKSVLLGRVITVEKARRSRGRTPTPGRYLGMRTVSVRRRSRSSSFSSERGRSYSPYNRWDRSSSPYYGRRRSYSSSRSPYSRSPVQRYRLYDSPSERYYRRGRYRSVSRSYSPRGRSYSPPPRRSLRRSYSRSYSPRPRRSSRRSYSRSYSPRPRSRPRSYTRRRYSRSRSPESRRDHSPAKGRAHSRDSYSSRSYGSRSPPSRSRSRSVSKSASPRSPSPSR